MAWDLDGVDQYARFTMSAALKAATGGPFTFGAVLWLDATTDGAIIHALDGTTGRHFLEVFGTYNFGTASAAKSGPAAVTGAWYNVILSKDTGNVPCEYTVSPIATAVPVSGTCTGGNLGNGAAPGAAGQWQVGRFALSATEYVNGRIASTWGHASYMNQAAREALTTWALTVTAASVGGLGWAIRYDTLSTLVDATGAGGNETGRFGTAAFTLVADPSGDPNNYFGGGGTPVTINDTSGGSSASGSAEQVLRGVVLTDGSGGATAGGSTESVLRGVVVGDTSGGGSGGSSAGGVLVGVTLADSSGGTGAGSSASLAPVMGVVVADTPGGASAGSSASTAVADRIVADTSGGGTAGGSADTAGAATIVQDVSGGGTAASSPSAVLAGVVLQDTSGGTAAAGSAGLSSAGVVLTDASGGAAAASSPGSLVDTPADVTIQDTSGAAGAGSSPEASETPTPTVVRDTMASPVLLSALACLQGEAAKVPKPPALYTIRSGDAFEPSVDPWTDECCAGVGWIRASTQYETEDFPEQASRVEGNCPPMWWAVVIEVGISRCVPVMGDGRGSVVTTQQHLDAALAAEDDKAALRRVLCCLRELYGVEAVTAGQVNPLPIQGNCGGVVMQVTVRRDACDC